jgi:hypothetical protein
MQQRQIFPCMASMISCLVGRGFFVFKATAEMIIPEQQ